MGLFFSRKFDKVDEAKMKAAQVSRENQRAKDLDSRIREDMRRNHYADMLVKALGIGREEARGGS